MHGSREAVERTNADLNLREQGRDFGRWRNRKFDIPPLPPSLCRTFSVLEFGGCTHEAVEVGSFSMVLSLSFSPSSHARWVHT